MAWALLWVGLRVVLDAPAVVCGLWGFLGKGGDGIVELGYREH